MGLPSIGLKTQTVDVGGEQIEVRELTRGETMALAQQADGGDMVAQEQRVLACALGVPLEELVAWYDGAPSAVVQRLVTAIMSLSGLDGELGNGSAGIS